MRLKHTWLLALFVIVLAGCGNSDGFGMPEDEGQLIRGLDITAVALYQSIKVPLMENGEEVTERPVEVVQGKNAMVRIFVAPRDDWEPRNVVARLDFESELAETPSLEVEQLVTLVSDEAALDTTLNIDIPGEYLVGDLGLSVSLWEVESDLEEDIPGDEGNVLWPAEGMVKLNEQATGGPLRLVLIPVKYTPSEPDYLPDISDAQLELYRNAFYVNYPVDEIEITVGEELEWNQNIASTGVGWNQLLSKIQKLRTERGADKKEYYYGIFAPAKSLMGFCGMGCVAGLSNLVPGPAAAWARASIGLGFTGGESAGTMIHEVGHAHGRKHAPCKVTDADPKYPHAGGIIGVWGYDLNTKKLKAEKVKDFMSYCKPTWVSDYTYNALFTRVKAVNALAHVITPQWFQRNWLSLSIDLDGSISMGPELELESEPGGEERILELIGTNGQVIDVVTGYFSPYSHIPGGLVLFPEPSEEVVSVRLQGFAPVVLAPFPY
ncbi:MAG: hypothetical protein GY854_05180 [Deltaproteobacteria bacterium]|nr:hypothetical protein [Deltaproteobacteria bacterium]